MTSTLTARNGDTLAAQDMLSHYGDATVRDEEGYAHVVGRLGLLIDHTDAFEAAGGTIRTGLHAMWAILPGYPAVPVVCGDIIEIVTEDGKATTRCGLNVVSDGACEGHAEQHAYWASQSEAEICAWEQERDMWS